MEAKIQSQLQDAIYIPTLRPADQTSAFSQKLPISQVYAYSFTLHNPIETPLYYAAK